MTAAELKNCAAAPLYTLMTVIRPLKQLGNGSVAILGRRFRGSYHNAGGVQSDTVVGGRDCGLRPTYMDALPAAYILGGSDIVPAEPVPTTLVKRSRSEKDWETAAFCRIEGEEIAAITLSPFLPD